MEVAAQPAGVRAAVTRVVAAAVTVAVAGGTPTAAAGHAATNAGTPVTARRCAAAGTPFTPATLAIDGVLPAVRVLPLGRDDHGVPKPPPLTEEGRWQFAWDRASHLRPGDASGVVRLTAHTYPRQRLPNGRTPALGNLLLERLRQGADILVRGSDGARLCYRVTRRQQVRADASLSGYYDTAGAPRLAILVCSGERRGPGDWSHRTIWWAQPTHAAE